MNKTLKILILMIITLFLMTVTVNAADFSVKMETTKKDNEIELHIKLDELNITGSGISVMIFDLQYDRNDFKTVTSEDIISQNGWGSITYNEKTGTMLIMRNDFTNEANQEIVTVKLQPTGKGNTEIKLTEIQASNAQNDLEAEPQTIKINLGGLTFGNIIITILKVIGILIALLFILRILIKSKNKRRKR